ncbi:hypothetical protein Vadar_030487 [Vaccinium darrowii]|uniref:Uncharacterized protein n=1 Tax=Vaccinium darrowii TaxID=229202 RepID=A0ACB7Y354_9ERIC|nr:hypothetical protein Vadar_030487 [Vaccinium darrowii]
MPFATSPAVAGPVELLKSQFHPSKRTPNMFHQYQVVGRGLPLETDEHPKIYRMKLWSTNEVRAKSKFWYVLRKLKKVKQSNGQMLAINEVKLPLKDANLLFKIFEIDTKEILQGVDKEERKWVRMGTRCIEGISTDVEIMTCLEYFGKIFIGIKDFAEDPRSWVEDTIEKAKE